MKTQLIKVFIVMIGLCAMAVSQNNEFRQKGFYVQFDGKYNRFSNDVDLTDEVRYVADVKGAMGWGATIGYRIPGKGIVDVSLETNYSSSLNNVEYLYQFHPVHSTEPPGWQIDLKSDSLTIKLNSLSADVKLNFFNTDRLQPLFVFGVEYYLKRFTLKTPLLQGDQVRFNGSTTYYGWGLHAGIGLSYRLSEILAFNIYSRTSFRFLQHNAVIPKSRYDEFFSLNIDFGSSLSFFL